MSTIPATQIVNVQPNVLNAGGSALNLIGLILTTSTRLPIGSVVSFASPDSVGDYFGETSQEQRLATIYFAGFDGSNVKPGSVLFAQYNEVDVGAFLRGGNVSGLSVTQLQAINGPFAVTIDGNVESASINLSAATSFTSAAQLIQDTLGIEGPAGAAFTGSIATNVLTVASGLTGLLNVGDLVDGAALLQQQLDVVPYVGERDRARRGRAAARGDPRFSRQLGVASFVERARRIPVGDPSDPATVIGPMVSRGHLADLNPHQLWSNIAGLSATQWLVALLATLGAFLCVAGQKRAILQHMGYWIDPTHARGAAMAADPAWGAYLKAAAEGGMLIKMENRIVKEAPHFTAFKAKKG